MSHIILESGGNAVFPGDGFGRVPLENVGILLPIGCMAFHETFGGDFHMPAGHVPFHMGKDVAGRGEWLHGLRAEALRQAPGLDVLGRGMPGEMRQLP